MASAALAAAEAYETIATIVDKLRAIHKALTTSKNNRMKNLKGVLMAAVGQVQQTLSSMDSWATKAGEKSKRETVKRVLDPLLVEISSEVNKAAASVDRLESISCGSYLLHGKDIKRALQVSYERLLAQHALLAHRMLLVMMDMQEDRQEKQTKAMESLVNQMSNLGLGKKSTTTEAAVQDMRAGETFSKIADLDELRNRLDIIAEAHVELKGIILVQQKMETAAAASAQPTTAADLKLRKQRATTLVRHFRALKRCASKAEAEERDVPNVSKYWGALFRVSEDELGKINFYEDRDSLSEEAATELKQAKAAAAAGAESVQRHQEDLFTSAKAALQEFDDVALADIEEAVKTSNDYTAKGYAHALKHAAERLSAQINAEQQAFNGNALIQAIEGKPQLDVGAWRAAMEEHTARIMDEMQKSKNVAVAIKEAVEELVDDGNECD